MSSVEHYRQAATRANTRRSYQAAIEHFEVAWGGFLPATADSIARYLADHAQTLALNTLKLRLAALARWHQEQGFPDPTKAPLVRQVLKGIRECHPALEKRANPLQLDALRALVEWLTRQEANPQQRLRATRDRALVLLGFWRGFRGDELTRLRVEQIQVFPGEGLVLYLPRSKTDRSSQGREYRVPALNQLCPVAAYQDWQTLSGLTDGPVFRGIDRWGHLAESALNPQSIVPLLRALLTSADVADAHQYTCHSLRRGFASWAGSNGWDVQALMEYVGWKDIKSALRYIERADPFARGRIEAALPPASGGE
ncbi:MAG: site-specific integrase [Pseudomonadota bacterium]